MTKTMAGWRGRRGSLLLSWFAIVALIFAAGSVLGLRGARAAGIAPYREDGTIPPRARSLAAYQLDVWASPSKRIESQAALQRENPEWDLMARTFFVLALADMALRSPAESERLLAALDDVIADTLAAERAHGQRGFLLAYGRDRPFVARGGRSLFVDGEIALMLGVRQIVRPRADYRPLLRARVSFLERAMSESPTLSGESYPDECWTFCNTTALAALRVFDAVERTNHARLAQAWVALARERLVDPASGLLVSSYTYRGVVKDGPEGTTLWMSARNLLLVDDAFARDQYARARRELGGSVLGFGYAREWPRSHPGTPDVDSGPIVPFLEASPASSGFAVLGANAFGDARFLESLIASLELTGGPQEREGRLPCRFAPEHALARDWGRLHFGASNPVGDAVILSGLVFGPVWERVRSDASDSL
jgi:hypothetical protein